MIDKALSFLCDELNGYFQLVFNVKEEKVILSSLNGEQNADKVMITLVNIEEEQTLRNAPHIKSPISDRSGESLNPPINLNLYVLCSTSFNDHGESLKFLSNTLSFFQSKNVFTHQNAPLLDPNIEKLIVEHINMTYEDNAHLWQMLGSKYTPSVMYKVRMLALAQDRWQDNRPMVSGTV